MLQIHIQELRYTFCASATCLLSHLVAKPLFVRLLPTNQINLSRIPAGVMQVSLRIVTPTATYTTMPGVSMTVTVQPANPRYTTITWSQPGSYAILPGGITTMGVVFQLPPNLPIGTSISLVGRITFTL